MERSEVAKRLKRFRLEKLMTLREMAEAAGVSVQTISDLENDRRQPAELTLARIQSKLPGLILIDPETVAEAK